MQFEICKAECPMFVGHPYYAKTPVAEGRKYCDYLQRDGSISPNCNGGIASIYEHNPNGGWFANTEEIDAAIRLFGNFVLTITPHEQDDKLQEYRGTSVSNVIAKAIADIDNDEALPLLLADLLELVESSENEVSCSQMSGDGATYKISKIS